MNLPSLDSATVPYRLLGVSALEVFFGMAAGPLTTVEADAGLADLARVFDEIEFPGLPAWDVLVPREQGEILIRSLDREDDTINGTHPLLQFSWDPVRRTFHDPHDLYPLLKEARSRLKKNPVDGLDSFDPVPVDGLDPLEAALLCARFPFVPEGTVDTWEEDPGLPRGFHRLLLAQVLTGPFAWHGLEILMESGYIEKVLPELAKMNVTDHSKEGHPEGNVWRHTVETMRYRQTAHLAVALALLFHDCGKPFAEPQGARRFDGHADIGADKAVAMMRRIGFAEPIIRDVRWLVRYHMIPGALERLPDHRRGPLMESPLFPLLLEVYRCDLSSTYRGPEGYYRACKVYRRYMKKRRPV
jgi:poly(A) polymerase